MRWDYFATGSFENPVTAQTALRVVRNWLDGHDVYAAVGVQRGPVAERFHVHALVGGCRTRSLETHLRGSWVRHGHMKIDPYRHSMRGVEYMVNQADEIELLGDPRPYERRKGRNEER